MMSEEGGIIPLVKSVKEPVFLQNKDDEQVAIDRREIQAGENHNSGWKLVSFDIRAADYLVSCATACRKNCHVFDCITIMVFL